MNTLTIQQEAHKAARAMNFTSATAYDNFVRKFIKDTKLINQA